MEREPYRALFPLGLLWGASGVGLWLIYFAGLISIPIASHAFIMIFGFFLSFVSGFLMTALPKMTGSFSATKFERSCAVALITTGVGCAVGGHFAAAYALSVVQIGFLLWFGLRRPHSRTGGRVSGFIFIPAALAWAAFGGFVHALAFASIALPSMLLDFGRVAIQEAFLLNLIVGIGGRLIPFLTRVQSAAPHEKAAELKQPYWAIFGLLNLSFFLEGVGAVRSSWALRAVVLFFAAVTLFKLHSRRPVSSHLGNGLLASIGTMIVGYALLAFLPGYKIALLHIVFIGGFTLVTLMVATRVVLSHGGFSLEIERKSVFVLGAAVLLLAAALFRGFYFLPVAATLWLAAAVFWFFGIGRKVFQ